MLLIIVASVFNKHAIKINGPRVDGLQHLRADCRVGQFSTRRSLECKGYKSRDRGASQRVD